MTSTFTLSDSTPLFSLFWNVNGVMPASFNIHFEADGIRVRQTVTHSDNTTSIMDLLMNAGGFDTYQLAAPFIVSFTWTQIKQIFPLNTSYTRSLTISYDPSVQKLTFDFIEPVGNINRETVYTFSAPLVTNDTTTPALPATPNWDATVTMPIFDLEAFIGGLKWFSTNINLTTTLNNSIPLMTFIATTTDGSSKCTQYARNQQLSYTLNVSQPSSYLLSSAALGSYSSTPAPEGTATIYLSSTLVQLSFAIQSTVYPSQRFSAQLNCYFTV